MDYKSADAIIRSILEEEADKPTGPSGPVLVRLTELAEAGDLRGFSETFIAFARAKRPNARYVEARVPAKIVEAYLLRQPGVMPAAVRAWQGREPEWAARLEEAVWAPIEFETLILAIANELKSAR